MKILLTSIALLFPLLLVSQDLNFDGSYNWSNDEMEESLFFSENGKVFIHRSNEQHDYGPVEYQLSGDNIIFNYRDEEYGLIYYKGLIQNGNLLFGLDYSNSTEKRTYQFKNLISPQVDPPEFISIDDENDIYEDLEIEEDHEDLDEIFMIVEEPANFPGGMQAFVKYLGDEIKYPEEAIENGIEGRVFLAFVVDKKGNLRNIEVQRGIGGGCDEEAIRVLKNSPKWNPAKQRGQRVNSRMTIPVTFSQN